MPAEAIDPTRSFCVSAPAGSENRAAHTAAVSTAGGADRPEQVLAITFARKAASEMALRVMEKLEQASENVPITAEHERQTRALALAVIDHAEHKHWRLDDTTLTIRTIDSFCHELTRQMPILSGTGGLVEPAYNAQPYEEAVRQFLAQAGEGAMVSGFISCLRILITAGPERLSCWSPCWDAGVTGTMSLINTMIPRRPKRVWPRPSVISTQTGCRMPCTALKATWACYYQR